MTHHILQNFGSPLYAVSACLIGYRCRYDGLGKKNSPLVKKLGFANILPICPEIFGGLLVSRPKCSIVGGNGFDVLNGNASVMTYDNRDLTSFFLKGAYLSLEIIFDNHIKQCFLKSKSPSCGSGLLPSQLHDNHNVVPKNYKKTLGVTAALFLSKGLRIEEIL